MPNAESQPLNELRPLAESGDANADGLITGTVKNIIICIGVAGHASASLEIDVKTPVETVIECSAEDIIR